MPAKKRKRFSLGQARKSARSKKNDEDDDAKPVEGDK
jgi:hypothetical protein